MFLFTAAANDIFRRADLVANKNRGPSMLGPIGLSMTLNVYIVYQFVYSDKVKLLLFSPVSHSSS